MVRRRDHPGRDHAALQARHPVREDHPGHGTVNYPKADLMIPLATLGEGPLNVEAANVAEIAWCAEVNAAVHSETMAVPADRLETERSEGAGEPGLADRTAPVLRRVDRLSRIWFGSARYSVPVAFIGRRVEVHCVGARIRVNDTVTGEIVADHRVVPPGEASILDEHHPRPRPTTPRRAIRPRTAAEHAFCALGRSRRRSSSVLPQRARPGWSGNCPS